MGSNVIDRAQYLDHLETDIAAFASAVEAGPLGAPVPWCGDWQVADLAVHLGSVHRWAAGAARHGTPAGASAEEDADPAPADPSELGSWLRAGGQRLLAVLGALDPEAPTWHPFPVAKVGAVWPRRQAQETSVHRWDAERAIGLTPTIDRALAADGIDEYFAVALPRLMRREGVQPPVAPLLVETTDTGGRWLVGRRDDTIALLDEAEPASRISGTAEHVLLALWRRPVPEGTIAQTGSSIDWLDLGGI